jgi:Ca2+-binding RTX toxin-like protein
MATATARPGTTASRRRPWLRRAGVLTALLCLTGALPARASDRPAECDNASAGVSCSDGGGRQTPGGEGTGKVSHAGWPAITGVLMQADNAGRTLVGGEDNDELLGGHGDDHLVGGDGRDVLWGDKWPTGNTPRQEDVLNGGAGADWIYPSHGTNIVRAGAGNDHIKAYYGHGSIDCGPGKDVAQVRMNGAYSLQGCEHVVHFCQYGSSADGRCLSPTGKPTAAGVTPGSPRHRR